MFHADRVRRGAAALLLLGAFATSHCGPAPEEAAAPAVHQKQPYAELLQVRLSSLVPTATPAPEPTVKVIVVGGAVVLPSDGASGPP